MSFSYIVDDLIFHQIFQITITITITNTITIFKLLFQLPQWSCPPLWDIMKWRYSIPSVVDEYYAVEEGCILMTLMVATTTKLRNNIVRHHYNNRFNNPRTYLIVLARPGCGGAGDTCSWHDHIMTGTRYKPQYSLYYITTYQYSS